MSLISAADVRRYLPGLSGEDALLAVLIAAAEDHAARYCGLPPVAGVCSFAETEYILFGDDPAVMATGRRLTLPIPPIVSVDEVAIDVNESWGASTVYEASDYTARGNVVIATATGQIGEWPDRSPSLRVTVTAGYATAPPALAAALAQLAAFMFRERHQQGLTNQSEGGRSVGLASGWPEMVTSLLAPFRVTL